MRFGNLIAFGAVLVIAANGWAAPNGLTKYERIKLKAAAKLKDPGLETICTKKIKPVSEAGLYKHPGSPHLPSHEQQTMTFILDISGPKGKKIKGYDSKGNLVTILGEKFPRYLGKFRRFYNMPTGDGRTAQKVEKRAKKSGKKAVYFRVNGTCYEVTDVTKSRFGGI